MDMLLTSYKCKPFAKLKQKFLQIINYGLLQISFPKGSVCSETQKFPYDWIFNKLCRIGRMQWSRKLQHLFLDKVFALRGKHAMIILRADIALKRSYTPILRCGFSFIPLTGFIIKLLNKNTIM